jgi:hypothetical protein
MRTIAEEIMTDLLWLQADKQSVSLLTETCLSVFKMPLDNVCMMDLNSVCTAIEFLSLQLEDQKLVRNIDKLTLVAILSYSTFIWHRFICKNHSNECARSLSMRFRRS